MDKRTWQLLLVFISVSAFSLWLIRRDRTVDLGVEPSSDEKYVKQGAPSSSTAHPADRGVASMADPGLERKGSEKDHDKDADSLTGGLRSGGMGEEVQVGQWMGPSDRKSRMKDPWAKFQVLEQRDTVAPDGSTLRDKLVKSEGKYQLILVEEKFNPGSDPSKPGAIPDKRTSMVADHVMITVKPKVTQEQVEQLAASIGGQIRRHLPNSQVYLISFEASNVYALKQMVETLKQSKLVNSSEPDYIVHL